MRRVGAEAVVVDERTWKKVLYTHEADLEGSNLEPLTRWLDLGIACGAIATILGLGIFQIVMVVEHPVLHSLLSRSLV